MSAQRVRAKHRWGAAIPTALGFAVASLVLAWLAAYALYGPYGGSPRRTVVAAVAIILAFIGFGVAIREVVRRLRRHRLLEDLLRPGEVIAGLFPVELVDRAEDGQVSHTEPAGITLTNQRLMIHKPESNPEPSVAFEHEEIAGVGNWLPIRTRGSRRHVHHVIELADGGEICVRMGVGTAVDFIGPNRQYLSSNPREMRALVAAAEGPTPSRPSQPIDAIMLGSRPTVCMLELAENYLRVVGEDAPPLADLYHYFHWEHMTVDGPGPGCLEGLPVSWRQVTLTFHGDASLTLCGTAGAMQTLRNTALARGAREGQAVDSGSEQARRAEVSGGA